MRKILLILVTSLLSVTVVAGDIVTLDKASIIAKAKDAGKDEMQKRPDLAFSFYQMTYTVDSDYKGRINVRFRSNQDKKTTQHGSVMRTVVSYEFVTVTMDEDQNIIDVSSSTGGKNIRIKTN